MPAAPRPGRASDRPSRHALNAFDPVVFEELQAAQRLSSEAPDGQSSGFLARLARQ